MIDFIIRALREHRLLKDTSIINMLQHLEKVYQLLKIASSEDEWIFYHASSKFLPALLQTEVTSHFGERILRIKSMNLQQLSRVTCRIVFRAVVKTYTPQFLILEIRFAYVYLLQKKKKTYRWWAVYLHIVSRRPCLQFCRTLIDNTLKTTFFASFWKSIFQNRK